MFRLFSNVRGVAQRMANRAKAVAPILDRQAQEIRSFIEKESRRHMQRLIYDRPVPVNPRTGRPRWKRTRRLYENEKAKVVRTGDGNRVELKNRMRYARPRHDMGKPWAKRPKVKPYARQAFWRDETVRVVRNRIRTESRASIRRILRSAVVAFPPIREMR